MFFKTRREISCLCVATKYPLFIPQVIKDQTRSDLKISRSSPVSFHEIVETSRKVTNLHTQSCPETSASFHNYFSFPKLPWVAVAQSANPST